MLGDNRVRVLVADAESARFLCAHLSKRNYDVSTAATGDEALRLFRVLNPSIILLDVGLPGSDKNVFEVLERMKSARPEVAVIVLTDNQDAAVIFRISKLGADDLLAKPVQIAELEQRVSKYAEKAKALQDRAVPTPVRKGLLGQPEFGMLFGASPAMDEVRSTIEHVAGTTATVLIRGESGTGKEVTARLIYGQSSRRDKPFVKVNCAAIPHELLESELFGYEPGAFTGANRQRLGKFEQATYGTIFLDEISEMHPALQAKLLHVLQDGSFSRLGGKREISVDVRVLAATNKGLEQAVLDGQFREDLFYRLNVITIHIPPLRERREEIPVLLTYFHTKYCEVYGKNPQPFSDAAVQRMLEYAWPGNIRELENLVKRYVIVGNEAQITRELAHPRYPVQSPSINAAPEVSSLGRSLALNADESPSLLEVGRRAAMKAEHEMIERVLHQTRWNRRQAAKILKISYKALLNKLKIMEEEERIAAGSGSKLLSNIRM